MLQLWYQKPATYWEEALPLGNGRLGAMVWSGVDHETLSLNEDSLWSGYPKCADIPGAVEYYKQAQQLAREKKYSEAGNTAAVDEELELEHPQGDVDNYRRSLSLEDAISRLTYTIGGTTYTREAFVSAPDQAIVLRIQADKPGSITLKARFDCRLRSSCTIEDGRLVLDGVAPSQVDPSYLGETPNPIVYEEDPRRRACASAPSWRPRPRAAPSTPGRTLWKSPARTASPCWWRPRPALTGPSASPTWTASPTRSCA